MSPSAPTPPTAARAATRSPSLDTSSPRPSVWTDGIGGGRTKILSVGSMVLGDEMREDEPTNLVSAEKNGSYGFCTDDRRRAWPGDGAAGAVPALVLGAVLPEAGGVASLLLPLPLPLLLVRRCSPFSSAVDMAGGTFAQRFMNAEEGVAKE